MPAPTPAELPPAPTGSTNVLGVRVAALTLRGAAQRILAEVRARRKGHVCVTGVHGVIECRADPDLGAIHNRAVLTVPDGMPLVWALHRDGFPWAERIYGPDLMLAVLDQSQGTGIGHYLYGTTPEVLSRLERRLQQRFPRLRFVGSYSPPFRALTDAEEDAIAARINASGAGIVWVGLSTPKQERWMARMRDRLDAPILIGVGAAFDFHAGLKPQAPPRLQRAGLEWAFRLATEPRRLWRRYARIVPSFLALHALQRSGWRSFPFHGDASPSPTQQERTMTPIELTTPPPSDLRGSGS
ncbi:WecB/TagA/CpsF family glycosyltransferase [Falsirhodobacter algicola]|uniref:WecB/TagA/CpsF family glycosyltransferase n=1 Tax=Falsirhodobacter algicola TaxID=2692330 RepID=A0A8J8SK80_9RHOB|nr:WecB/TagA/CpsF family glycosyltransferase [Falsirhodobacter algicola]QUS35114.1 WecB/TagA/CpsF family glycosyltransferase [Falsirhodobacter algicola]